MDMKLEVVPLPITDVERSLSFYVNKVGFHLDHDVQPGNGMRVIQTASRVGSAHIPFRAVAKRI